MRATAPLLVLLATWTVGCGDPTLDGASTPPSALPGLAADDTADPALAPPRRPRLWATCGDPVCSGHTPVPGMPLCGTRAEGDLCGTANLGRQCDPVNACNSHLECRRDPSPGPCPISRARHKEAIDYLSDDDLDALHRELLALPLARWAYIAEGGAAPTHVGFLIDDAPASIAVAADGEHVDLYGYTSMAVAALQSQQRTLDAQAAEIQSLKDRLARLEAALR